MSACSPVLRTAQHSAGHMADTRQVPEVRAHSSVTVLESTSLGGGDLDVGVPWCGSSVQEPRVPDGSSSFPPEPRGLIQVGDTLYESFNIQPPPVAKREAASPGRYQARANGHLSLLPLSGH